MLFIFKSATNGDLIMHEENGKEILALLGKVTEEARGIITVEQLPGAIVTLQKAIVAAKGRPQDTAPKQSNTGADDEPPIGLAQRAAPFIEMLERAVKAGEPVVWGV